MAARKKNAKKRSARRGKTKGTGQLVPLVEYAVRRGYSVPKTKVASYGQRIAELSSQGPLPHVTADDVLDDARNPASPLHSWFEWDDDAAAEAHRLAQARYLLRAIDIRVRFIGGERRQRAWVSVRVSRVDELGNVTKKRAYADSRAASKHDELWRQVLADSLHGLDSWYQRWTEFLEVNELDDRLPGALRPVLDAIERGRAILAQNEAENAAE